jgi:hypothetical protein
MLYDVKKSLLGLVNVMASTSQIAIMTFSSEASLVQSFTQNIEILSDRIMNFRTGGSTEILPVLKKADSLFELDDDKGKYLIIVTDGIVWDKKEDLEILGYAQKLVDKGVCIYSIGLGNIHLMDDKAQKTLELISSKSINKLGCGGYRHAFVSEMDSVFRDITKELKMINDDLYLSVFLSNQKLALGEPLFINTEVYSSFNDLLIPTEIYYDDLDILQGKRNICIMPPKLNIEVSDSKKIIYESDLSYIQNNGYSFILRSLEEGIYDIKIKSQIVSSNIDCDIFGEEKFKIMYLDKNKEIKKQYLFSFLIFDLILILCIFFLIRKLR